MANRPEVTLDPHNWESLRRTAHQMVDDMLGLLENIREQPVWQPMPPEARDQFRKALPLRPQSLETVYDEFKRYILPYPQGNIHPRFWGWVMGNGTPVGMLADMLASAMNSNVCLGDHAALRVEEQVLDWCKELMGYPQTASGLLTSGASMANLTALLTALHHATAGAVRQIGLAGQTAVQPTLYCSRETHNCIQKAVEVMGLGSVALRKIPVDDQYRIRIDLLEQSICTDLSEGRIPFCIVGNAGTVNTGAIDPLDELLALSRKYRLWFHIDGAFGAWAKRTPAYVEQLRAIEEADSVAFDLHKWLYMPYEVGCVLIRNAAAHRRTFEQAPNYLLQHERGTSAGEHSFGNYGIELSRGFKALKVWMSLKTHGAFSYLAMISQNIAQAGSLAARVERHPRLELLAPRSLNIVCFRYVCPGMTEEDLSGVNREILMRLQEEGIAVLSATVLGGRYALRAAISNHRSRQEDLDILVKSVLRIGDEFSGTDR